MLTKKDLELLDGVVRKAVKAGFEDFYDNIFLPQVDRSEEHMERSEKQHEELIKRFDRNDKEHKEIHENLGEIIEHVKDHSNRIRKLESVTSN